jgi:hypothetical protein
LGEDPFLRTGPPLALALSPGEQFRNLLHDWKASAHLAEDNDTWDKAFSEIGLIMFNRSTDVIFRELTVEGRTAVTHKWSIRDPAISVERAALLSLALRLARDLGLNVLTILRLEARYRWKALDQIVNVMDKTYEVPVEVFLCETIRAASHQLIVGEIMPPEEALADPDFPTWWGLLAITLRTRSYLVTLRNFFTDYTSAWTARAENKNAYMAISKFRADKRRSSESAATLAAAAAVLTSAGGLAIRQRERMTTPVGQGSTGTKRKRKGRGRNPSQTSNAPGSQPFSAGQASSGGPTRTSLNPTQGVSRAGSTAGNSGGRGAAGNFRSGGAGRGRGTGQSQG